jgi:hypothetical protein
VFVKINFSLLVNNIFPIWNMPPLYKDNNEEVLSNSKKRLPKLVQEKKGILLNISVRI